MNLTGLRLGTESFDRFARRTDPEWRALAAYICRRVAPSALGYLDDVVQELLLECWLHVPRWDPKRGMALDRFCIFGSVSQVTRRLRGKLGEPLSLARVKQRRGVELGDRAIALEPAIEARLIIEQALAGQFRRARSRVGRELICDATHALLEAEGVMAAASRLRARGVGKKRALEACREARRGLMEAYAA